MSGHSKWATTKHKKALASQRHQRVHRQFLADLWRAQRLLANVPTYMIFDDHDVTDDYFLTPMWRHRVLGSTLGQTILTNAMTAYALFQDWGNDPRRYDVTATDRPDLAGGLPSDVLVAAQKLFPGGADQGPAKAPFTALGKLFGHDKAVFFITDHHRCLMLQPLQTGNRILQHGLLIGE